ncbi:hypothetical protein LCGC14_0767880 [marine sediment metagenome]|uniref:Uncharacterized protein n=1 Tax=marine sediment metagenome TaxID=412755 RepID=A0A0F9T659_9ZZZZ
MKKKKGYILPIAMILLFVGFLIIFALSIKYDSGVLTLISMAFMAGMAGVFAADYLNNDDEDNPAREK